MPATAAGLAALMNNGYQKPYKENTVFDLDGVVLADIDPLGELVQHYCKAFGESRTGSQKHRVTGTGSRGAQWHCAEEADCGSAGRAGSAGEMARKKTSPRCACGADAVERAYAKKAILKDSTGALRVSLTHKQVLAFCQVSGIEELKRKMLDDTVLHAGFFQIRVRVARDHNPTTGNLEWTVELLHVAVRAGADRRENTSKRAYKNDTRKPQLQVDPMNTKRADLEGEELLHVGGMPATGIPLCFFDDIPEQGPAFAYASVGNDLYVDIEQMKPRPWSADRTTVERFFLVQDDPTRPGGRGCTVECARAARRGSDTSTQTGSRENTSTGSNA